MGIEMGNTPDNADNASRGPSVILLNPALALRMNSMTWIGV